MNIRFINSPDGDWVGMYIDRKLVAEGHSLDPFQVLEPIQHYLKNYKEDLNISSTEQTREWFEKHGDRCPPELGEDKD